MTGKSFAEQLAPTARRLRQSLAVVRPVSATTLELRSSSRDNDQFSTARNIVLDWLGLRGGRPLPEAARRGESFDLEEVGSQRAGAVAIESPRYWAARLDDSDSTVPQRAWVTEIGIGEAPSGNVVVGSRLLCVSRGADAPYRPSIQKFIRQIAEDFQDVWVDGRRLTRDVWLVDDEFEADILADLLERKSRRCPVVVCSLPDGSETIGDCVIDAAELHRMTLGAAHVAVLTSSASYYLTDRVGKEFSVFRGAIRTYRPGFDTQLDEPFRHPLAMPTRIKEWPDGGPVAYNDFLVSTTLYAVASLSDSEAHIPSFAAVRRIAADRKMEAARSAGSSDRELLELADAEIADLRDTLRKDKETYEGLVAQYEGERDQAVEEAQQAQAAQGHLRQRIRELEAQLQQQASGASDVHIPNSLEDFEGWCRSTLSGAIDLHNRAFQGVKKSQFDDVSLIYRSLLLLKDHYVPMRREGGIELRKQYEVACRKLGLTEEPTFSGDRYGEQGDEYIVRYAGRRELLDRHLKKGSSRDERRCFRLYFFWDNQNEQVVVGWLPSHLDTRIT